MSKNRENFGTARAEEKVYHDPSTSTDERVSELFKEHFEGEQAGVKRDPADEAILSGREAGSINMAESAYSKAQLFPSLHDLYKDSPHLSYDGKGSATDYTLAPGDEPKVVRIRKVTEPDDIYDPHLDKRLWNVFQHIILETKGFKNGKKDQGAFEEAHRYIAEIKNFAAGRGMGANPVSLIRQKMWAALFHRKVKINGHASSPRTTADEDESTTANRRLALLLNWSIYDVLCDQARQNDYSNNDAFCYVVYDMVNRGLFAEERG